MIKNATPNVIVVESNDECRDRLCALLAAMQFRVEQFENAEAFIQNPDLPQQGCVVAGLRLGGMSGLELQARLKEMGCLLPVVLVSERASTQLIVRAMRGGAVAFLDMPIKEDDLWLAVREAMTESSHRVHEESKRNELRARFSQLSDGEMQVLTSICRGLTNKEIASHLDVSVRTVESRRRRILQKTGTGSLPELLLSYQQFRSTCQDAASEPSLQN